MSKRFDCEGVKTQSIQLDAELVNRLLKTDAQMGKSL